ncbi:Uncharacterised protein [Klebsiella pneumoniae]|nr:Uncharacterised protein [Klebsiella pneumoniae]
MTISLQRVSNAALDWFHDVGLKEAGALISDEYHAAGGGDLLPRADSIKGVENAAQRINRIFSNHDGPRYRVMAESLKEPVLRAMPVMRRSAVTMPDEPIYLTAIALKEVTEFLNAVNLGASPRELLKEGKEARDALNKLFNSVIPQTGNLNATQ